jgi:hypothetical protein
MKEHVIEIQDVESSDAVDGAQLESLFDQVWRCEAEWRLDDRILLAARISGAVASRAN